MYTVYTYIYIYINKVIIPHPPHTTPTHVIPHIPHHMIHITPHTTHRRPLKHSPRGLSLVIGWDYVRKKYSSQDRQPANNQPIKLTRTQSSNLLTVNQPANSWPTRQQPTNSPTANKLANSWPTRQLQSSNPLSVDKSTRSHPSR